MKKGAYIAVVASLLGAGIAVVPFFNFLESQNLEKKEAFYEEHNVNMIADFYKDYLSFNTNQAYELGLISKTEFDATMAEIIEIDARDMILNDMANLDDEEMKEFYNLENEGAAIEGAMKLSSVGSICTGLTAAVLLNPYSKSKREQEIYDAYVALESCQPIEY